MGPVTETMRLLGRTGLMVSPLILGTMEFGPRVLTGRARTDPRGYYLDDSFADFRPHPHHW